MKLSFPLSHARPLVFFLVGLVFSRLLPQSRADATKPENEYQPANDEFDPVGRAVVELLKSHDPVGFATNLSVRVEDWQSVATTNLSSQDLDALKSYAKGAGYNNKRLNADAQAVLSRADALHLSFAGDNLRYEIVAPSHLEKIYLFNRPPGGLTLPYLEKLDILLFRGAASNQPAGDGFRLTVRGLEKFPAGWRINSGLNGIQWTGFPTNVADAKTLRELVISEKIAAHKGLASLDDPTLLQLGESLVHFIRERDVVGYQRDLLLNSEMVWSMFEKTGRKGPTRQEVDDEVGRQNQEQAAVATKILQQMAAAGIDLKTADIEIKEASLEQCQSAGGLLEQWIGSQFKLRLAVKTDAKARNGTLLSGDYVLAVKQIMKLGDAWKVVQDTQWEKLPPGVVDPQTAASIEFENHVAKHNALPQGMTVPEIEFTTLTGEKKMKLSELRGKIVVFDFWATWCGPCQQPMADLQKIREGHPDWQDKVAIVPVSIDDTMNIVRQHIEKRGWTNTFNVWAGSGGWHSIPAKAFRVTAVPTSYIIDPQGKILWAGHPEVAGISTMIDRLLKQ